MSPDGVNGVSQNLRDIIRTPFPQQHANCKRVSETVRVSIQHPSSFPESQHALFDEVAYGPLQLQWNKEDVIRRVDETLEFMSISRLRDRPPYRLSEGEKKRVALASVLVLDPEVLLLDEPTATLDPKSQSQVVDLIQQWKGTAKTVITATHQLEIVEDIADRVFVLEAGTVIAEGTPSEILSNTDLLLRANLIHAHRHSHEGVVHSHPHLHGHSRHEHEH